MEKILKNALILFFFGCLPATANAATLFFSPTSGKYAVDKTFSVNVRVSSADQAINAASSLLLFPQDKLKVVSLSKSDSIFTLWIQEPSFSNASGTINFEGMILNPGFMGASGQILTINFKAKTAGMALLNSSSSSVLANNGEGDNILTSFENAQFNLGNASPPAPAAPISTNQGSVFKFTRDLRSGSTGNDVKQLQIFLNNHGLILARSGVGSKGRETTLFGLATKKALMAFQKTNHLKVDGLFAGKTRTLIQSKMLAANHLLKPSNPKFLRDLKLGSMGSDVKLLQIFLNTHGVPVARSGVGSKGRETTLFGLATKKALMIFEQKNHLKADGILTGQIRKLINAMK